MLPIDTEQILLFFVISICKRIFDPQQIISSGVATTLVEAAKSVLSRRKKPLTAMRKEELESLLDEFKEEIKTKNENLATRITETKTEIIKTLETTIESGDEAIINEIKKNRFLEQEILEALTELKASAQRQEKKEQLNSPWNQKPDTLINYISRKETEQIILQEIDGDYTIICIEGIPGTGKSYLLNRIHKKIYEKRHREPFWCKITKQYTTDTILEAIARYFSNYELHNVKKSLLSSERDYANIYDNIKRNLALYEFIFFFDNFDMLKDEQARFFLESLLELDLRSKIILATREAVLPRSLSHKVKRISLLGLTQEEVRQFLSIYGIDLEDTCFQKLCDKTEKIPMLIFLAAQKLRTIEENQYSKFINNLPNRDIERYLLESVHECLDTDEQVALQVMSVLQRPEPIQRILHLFDSIDVEHALDKLEDKFLIIRDFVDNFFSHEIIRDFYSAFMFRKAKDFLCKLNIKAYEMYKVDFEEGDVEAGVLAIDYAESILDFCDAESSMVQFYIPILTNKVANGFLEIHKPMAAIEILDFAIKRYGKEKMSRTKAVDLNTLAKAYLITSNPEKAREYLEEALDIDKEIGDKRHLAIDMNLLGKAWLDSNKPEKAREYLEEALDIHTEIGDKRSQAIDMNLLGKISRKLFRITDAITYYENALEISKEINDTKNISYNLYPLAHLFFEKEIYIEAKRYFQEFLNLPPKIYPKGRKIALKKLGEIYEFEGNTAKSLQFYKQALDSYRGKHRWLENKIHELEQTQE